MFTRHSFSISLTDEGMLLRDRAEDLIAMADRIEQEFITLDDITGGLVFRPLSPKQTSELYLIWNKYPSFTPIAEKFLTQIKTSFHKP